MNNEEKIDALIELIKDMVEDLDLSYCLKEDLNDRLDKILRG